MGFKHNLNIDPEWGEIGAKRFNLPRMSVTCPKCGNNLSDGGDSYISYPKPPEEVGEVYMYCGMCDTSFNAKVRVSITVEQVGDLEVGDE